MIYLPPDYETNATRRYPVVYFLHGYGGNPRAGDFVTVNGFELRVEVLDATRVAKLKVSRKA